MGFPPNFYLLSILLPVLLSGSGRLAHGELTYNTAPASSLFPSPTCTPSKGIPEGAAPLVHIAGPCATNPDRNYSVAQSLIDDTLRVASLQKLASDAARANETLIHGSKVAIVARSGVNIGSANFVVTIFLGNPPVARTVILDTGSFLSWVQCAPCIVRCYSQAEPLYDPSRSSTYRRVACNTNACNGLSARGCDAGSCVYETAYGDGSATTGYLSVDTLTLTTTSVFPNFVFGCGVNNRGLFQGISGLIGLGRNVYSLTSQVTNSLRKVFSYCLPSSTSTTGFFSIGPPLRANTLYTPMFSNDRLPGLYFIDLIGISVGGVLLPVPQSVFQTPGTFIDSGVVITRLPAVAYSALRSAFRAAMARFPAAPAFEILDTCYDFGATLLQVSWPTVTLHFRGLNVPLPYAGTFYTVRPRQVCLGFSAIQPGGTFAQIGNTQQRTFEVTYDNTAFRIGFSGNACS